MGDNPRARATRRRAYFLHRGFVVNTSKAARLFGLILGVCACSLAGAATADVANPKVAKKVSAAEPKVAAETIVLRSDHATAHVLADLVKQYQASKLGKVELTPFSTISGLDAVHAGTANVAGTARSAMPDRAEEQGTNFFPIAWDALVPIVEVNNPVGDISLKQLHDLYLGRLTNWKDLGGADAEIGIDGVAPPLDGVEYSTRLLLFHYGDQTVSVPRLYVNVDKLEEDIALNAHGIGMSTLSSAGHNPKVKMLSVEHVRASPATIADGSYPLYTVLYLAARDDDTRHAQVANFVEYTGSDAAKTILRKHDVVPYADASALIDKQTERVAFIDAHIHVPLVASTETPVSAPNATAQSLQRVAPTSERTLEAKDRAERIKAEKEAAKTADVH
jgi:phosphate transport system substrate-binding protein